MSTNLPFDTPTANGATRLAAAAGKIPPGLTRLAFSDAWGPSPVAPAPAPDEKREPHPDRATPAHVIFSALVALASIFVVALTR